MKIDLRPGDIFCTKNPMSLGRVINKVQSWTSRDGQSQYSHSGIIQNKDGLTIESQWTVRSQNLYEIYKKQNVLIGRWEHMSASVAHQGLKKIAEKYKGKWYPFYRLPFQLIPMVAKYTTIGGRNLVCSELVGRFLWECHLVSGRGTKDYPEPRHRWFTGTTPDTLADEIKRWGQYEVVFEGILKGEDE